MKLIYRVKFLVTNLDKTELRDFNIDLLASNNIIEFDSDQIPELPTSSETIKIATRNFKISSYNIEYIIEEGQVIQIYNVSIFDVDKDLEERLEKNKTNNELLQEILEKWGK